MQPPQTLLDTLYFRFLIFNLIFTLDYPGQDAFSFLISIHLCFNYKLNNLISELSFMLFHLIHPPNFYWEKDLTDISGCLVSFTVSFLLLISVSSVFPSPHPFHLLPFCLLPAPSCAPRLLLYAWYAPLDF